MASDEHAPSARDHSTGPTSEVEAVEVEVIEPVDLEAGADGPQPNGHRAGWARRAAEMWPPVDRALTHPDARFGQMVFAGTLAFFIVVGVVWPTPIPMLALGLVFGSLSALIAMGLVLIYRANRIVNFAQGEIGAVAAILSVSLIVGPHWPFWPAVLVGLGAAVVLGALVEFAIIRRFARAPRLILTVATIGIASIMQGLELYIPTLFGYDIAPQDFPQPFPGTLIWNPFVYRGGHLLVVLAVPAIGVGLALFFVRTRSGRAVRAVAESSDRALLLGIPVKRIGTLVWVLAAAMSGVASLLRAPVAGIPIGQVLGPSLLLRALAAAVIGRMENLAVTFCAAIGLGVIEQAVLWNNDQSVIADGVFFFIILGALLLQRRGEISRAVQSGISSWSNIREVRPIPPELRGLPEVRWTLWALRVGTVAFLVLFPLALPLGRVNLLAFGVLVAVIGISLVVLTGWAGQISLGQWAFAGFGGAVAGWLALEGAHIFVALALGALVGAMVSIVLGLPAIRIRGPFLAVATLGFALASRNFFLNPDFFDYVPREGERVIRPILFGKFDLESEWTFYYLALAVFGLVVLSVRSLRNSRTGRALLASRENERAAQAFGVNLTRARLTAFALAGFIAALAGAALAFHQHGMFVTPLNAENSLRLFSIVVFGGLGSVPGVVLGAAFFTFFDFFVTDPTLQLVTSGAGLLLVLLFIPGGIGQVMYDIRDALLRWVAARRALVVPSLVADLRVDDQGRPIVGDGR